MKHEYLFRRNEYGHNYKFIVEKAIKLTDKKITLLYIKYCDKCVNKVIFFLLMQTVESVCHLINRDIKYHLVTNTLE